MSASDIIKTLGGRQSVAAITGARATAVGMWRRIGIPAKYWPVLVDHAAAHGLADITFASLRATKPPPPRAEAEQHFRQEAA